jgi:hypothetical protein
MFKFWAFLGFLFSLYWGIRAIYDQDAKEEVTNRNTFVYVLHWYVMEPLYKNIAFAIRIFGPILANYILWSGIRGLGLRKYDGTVWPWYHLLDN